MLTVAGDTVTITVDNITVADDNVNILDDNITTVDDIGRQFREKEQAKDIKLDDLTLT